MGTRCNVSIILSEQSTIILYRHWDGYPSETGADLARIATRSLTKTVNHWNDMIGFARAVMAKKRGGTDGNGRRSRDYNQSQYELTDSIHGDIEYHYSFKKTDYVNGSFFSVLVQDGNEETLFAGDLREFCEWVNKEIRETNARVRVRFPEAKPEPLLKVPN